MIPIGLSIAASRRRGGGGGGVPDFELVNEFTWEGATSATGTQTLTGAQSGDLVIIAANNDASNDPGWHLVTSSGYTVHYFSGGLGAQLLGVYYKVLGAGETSVDWKAHSIGSTPFVARLYRGLGSLIGSGTPAGTGGGGAGNPDPPAFNTATIPNLRIIIGGLDDDNTTLVSPAGFDTATSRGVAAAGTVAMAGLVDETGGNIDPAVFTSGGNDDHVALHLAFEITGNIP